MPKSINVAMPDVLDALELFGLQSLYWFYPIQHANYIECECPKHDSKICECLFAGLLIFWNNSLPVKLVAHEYDGRVQFYLDDANQKNREQNEQA